MKHVLKLGMAFCLLALVVPLPSAWGTPGIVPPGASGANQYMETLPGPGGDEPTSGHPGDQRGSDSREPGQVLGHSNAKKLEMKGAEGIAAARLAAEGAPGPIGQSGDRGEKKRGEKSPASGLSAGSSSSALRQVVGQLSGSSSGGMGLLLPILIAMAAVLAFGFVIVRRRTVHPGD